MDKLDLIDDIAEGRKTSAAQGEVARVSKKLQAPAGVITFGSYKSN